MAANRIQLQNTLHKPYDRFLFSKEVLSPVFGNSFALSTSLIESNIQPNQSESKAIDKVYVFGKIILEDGTEITCYEILLQPSVRIEQSKVAIQRYVRKLLTSGQAALVNFVAPVNKNVWRLTLVAKDSELTEAGVKEKTTHAKRYTFLLGPSESCKTAAERFETLSTENVLNFESLVKAFSVEKLSKAFFDEYTIHYKNFINVLTNSKFKKSAFENDEKAIRDFTKKLLGRIVFLYFVQKKGWLGASTKEYNDGLTNFMMDLFKGSGGDDTFYQKWLSILFFETLNKERKEDDFKMPNGSKVKIPFLNGGLFDKEEHDEQSLTLNSILFHNPDNPDDPKHRGFLDFLNAFNFTVHEDSPDDHTIAVDPEMLGHIFENLLEDNKDKGAFYTPKEIVHYMCQESLIEYLTTHLSKEYTVYKQLGNEQIELFGSEDRIGQLTMIEDLGDKALNGADVSHIVKFKDISNLTKQQLIRMGELLDTIKICDPSIGSGAFPMGLLQEIYSIKEVIAYETNTKWNPAKVKENIIQNSIYGVDVEKGAVDIARLRFWLSLVVDEEKPKALPNLDYKIVVGNSLVSKFEGEVLEIDWDRKSSVGKADELVQNAKKLLLQIAEKQKEYFNPQNKDKKKQAKEIRELKLKLLVNQLAFNKAIFISTNPIKGGFAPNYKEIKENLESELAVKTYDKSIKKINDLIKKTDDEFEHFDWKLDFPEVLNPYLINKNGGFDIIIANPPYIKERDNAHIFKDVNDSQFGKLWHQGKMDYWFYFLHKAIDLKKEKGVVAFITSRYWLNSQGAKKLINRVSKELSFANVVDIGKLKVFDNVAGHHMIHIYTSKSNHDFMYKKLQNNVRSIKQNSDSNDIKIKLLKNSVVFRDNDEIIFANDDLNISIDIEPLGELFEVSQGVVEAADKISSKQLKEKPRSDVHVGKGVFVLTKEELNSINLSEDELTIIKPYLDPTDIGKYYINKKEAKYLIYSDKVNKELIAKKPSFKSLKSHLDNLKTYITSSNFPYGVHRARQKEYFEKPKIVFKGMFVEPEFAYDEDKFYFGFSFSSIIQKNESYSLKYLLAILNSKFANNWFYTNGKIRGAGVDIGVEKLRTFPIALTESEKIFENVVDYIMFLKNQTLTEVKDMLMVNYFEQIIDGMVYELYLPDVLQQHNRDIIKHLNNLTPLTPKMTDKEKMLIIKKSFDKLNEKEHPIRVNLFYMDSIPEIRIIEGKNENN